MTVFSIFPYALLDHAEVHQARADTAWRHLIERDAELLTTNYVLLETCALLQSRLGLAPLRTLHDDIEPLLHVEWTSEIQHQVAVGMVLAAERKKLSVVDCVSFQSMRENGVGATFCFDRHFREQGFDVIP